jgi:hypothetical protein
LSSCSGCTLNTTDGEVVNFNPPVTYVGEEEISDDEGPRLLYSYVTDGITSFDPGMKHYYKKGQN